MFTTVLPKNAAVALAVLGKNYVLPDKTYLAGGTALTLQFGHRLSVDFDFFTPNSFRQQILANNLAKIGRFSLRQEAKDTLLGTFEKTPFSLFTYRYPLLFKTTNLNGIALASPQDIAAMKIAAVMDRGTKKDFIDLYFLAKNGISLDQCLTLYDRKYQVLENNLYSIITALAYFTDAEKGDMPVMLKKVSWPEIKRFFESEVKRLAQEKLDVSPS